MDYCVNHCENVFTMLLSSSCTLTYSNSYLSNPKSVRLFFYPKQSIRKNRSSSLNLKCQPSIVRSTKLNNGVCSIRSELNVATNGGVLSMEGKGKRTDIKKILILGAGPIVIGQACEFDHSGTQACNSLREEGYEVLINSNPTTIITDPDMADRTYIEPLTPELVEQIIEKERPDALLPTMGGQTALNLAIALAESGVIEKYGVELIGEKLEAIQKAEDRDLFKQAMKNIGLKTILSGIGTTLDECFEIANSIEEFPLIIRPAFTLGRTRGGIAYNREEFEAICKSVLAASVTMQVLVEKSLLSWKEYELEFIRDLADNVVTSISLVRCMKIRMY